MKVTPPEGDPDGTCTGDKGDCTGIQEPTSMCEQKCKDGTIIPYRCGTVAPLCPGTGGADATKK